ncbi:MAG: hypothetical protein IAB19_09395 [Proteobacteria bacterium]|uniref:Organic solvent tolerance-like N-terminal domain-containing protein n=1 Tax=Candidatus Avisuccinivibrio stercorigallinarum TaxID=2840704 RepID=A0A9D9DCQ0_9GAMM|nr:hypothetical protein [Candidatus Avisuccinivibrio stercorigallinarum]
MLCAILSLTGALLPAAAQAAPAAGKCAQVSGAQALAAALRDKITCVQFTGADHLTAVPALSGRLITARGSVLTLDGAELTVPSGTELIVRGQLQLKGTKLQLAGTLINQGEISLDKESALYTEPRSLFKNNGRFEAYQAELSSAGELENSSLFTLYGAVLRLDGEGLNQGTLSLNADAFLTLGPAASFTNRGSITAHERSTLELTGRSRLLNQRTLQLCGLLRQRDEAQLVNYRQFSAGAASSWYLGERSRFENQRQAESAGQVICDELSEFANSGTFDLQQPGVLALKGGSTLRNQGSLRLHGRLIKDDSVQLKGKMPVDLSELELVIH